jgi:hypothetical protein
MPALANASAATRVATLCKRNVFIVDHLSVRFVGHRCTVRPLAKVGQVVLLPIYSAVEITPSILLPIAGIALGSETQRSTGERLVS